MKAIILVLNVFIVCTLGLFNEPSRPYGPNVLQGLNGFGFSNGINSLINPHNPYDSRRRCPECDPSVFSYCGDKLFHDSCCCSNPNNPYEQLPQQCYYADCSFLHANTCREHKLITACCCIKK
ncbi:uncharacterized protein LOC123308277 [Coccinella septempunctata]|uniref:uncharacterized protein LOC123308277 n=1 Tax=Coccinella septempunctata TaxID=41139 RepID=UPI001D0631C6|nr:uncharacterized protein LOC123308277 [Coccinella septempunctata]